MHLTWALIGLVLILAGLFIPALPSIPGAQVATNIFLIGLGFLFVVPAFLKQKSVKNGR